MIQRILYITPLLLLLWSCTGNKNTASANKEQTYPMLSHAQLFTLVPESNYTSLIIFNPWKNDEIYATYYLVKDPHTNVPGNGQKIQIPLKDVMVNSATHVGFMELLGELDKITGICNPEFIYNPAILQRVRDGKIKDMGDSFNLNIEQVLLLQPQAVITTAYNADDENSRLMRQSGLSILYNIEWQETTLLGRAEWIKFFGVLFDKEAQADSIFNSIEQNYIHISNLARNIDHTPTILSGQDFRGSWSMPGGKSFNAQLFADAGGDYFYKDNQSTGSISTTIEEALIHFNQADVWVGVQANTLKELGETDSKYKSFKAYQNGEVYNTNKRTTPSGGNDYWESGVARPDLLLSDMIKILHPNLMPDYQLTYYQKLN